MLCCVYMYACLVILCTIFFITNSKKAVVVDGIKCNLLITSNDNDNDDDDDDDDDDVIEVT